MTPVDSIQIAMASVNNALSTGSAESLVTIVATPDGKFVAVVATP